MIKNRKEERKSRSSLLCISVPYYFCNNIFIPYSIIYIVLYIYIINFLPLRKRYVFYWLFPTLLWRTYLDTLGHFFHGRYCRGIRGIGACYIYFDLLRFLFRQFGKAKLLSNVYLYYLYIVLFNWFYEFLVTVMYFILKDNKDIISVGFYYTIHFHFNYVLFRYTHTSLSSSL